MHSICILGFKLVYVSGSSKIQTLCHLTQVQLKQIYSDGKTRRLVKYLSSSMNVQVYY